MSNVKVIVGQTWLYESSKFEVVRITVNYINMVSCAGQEERWSLMAFRSECTFVPANDLEWCAVNESSWDNDYDVIYKDANREPSGKINYRIVSKHTTEDEYNFKQWHDMRIHLGLESDPIPTDGGVVDSEVEPVYTKAMAEDGELPPVGCECLMNVSYSNKVGIGSFTAGEHAGKKVYICSTFTNRRGLELAAYFGVDGNFGGVDAAIAFGYIDTRTDEEKLIDDIVSLVEFSLSKGSSPAALVKTMLDAESYEIVRKDASNGQSKDSN